jgi:hypothetical protein
MDDFTLIRATKLIGAFKQSHGRDISEAELRAQGIAAETIDALVRKGIVDKYQVTTGKGNQENRFKLHRDWRSLREH